MDKLLSKNGTVRCTEVSVKSFRTNSFIVISLKLLYNVEPSMIFKQKSMLVTLNMIVPVYMYLSPDCSAMMR